MEKQSEKDSIDNQGSKDQGSKEETSAFGAYLVGTFLFLCWLKV